MSDVPVLDLAQPSFWADPHAVLGQALEQHVCARSPQGGLTVLGYREVESLLRSPETLTVDLLAGYGIDDGPLWEWWSQVMFSTDPPDHTRLRRLVSRAFTPRRVRELRPVVERIVDGLLDEIRTRDGTPFDLVGGFAHQVPIAVMAHMLGVPDEDTDHFGGWTSELGLVFSPMITDEVRSRLEETIVKLDGYVASLIESRRAHPTDDLLTALIEAEESGDRLSGSELIAMVENLLFAGHDTTRSLLSLAPVVLMDRPDVVARLNDDPAGWPAAVEELLRFEPPVMGTARLAASAMEIGGIAVGAGEVVSVNLLAANRDPRVFDDPGRFVEDREGPAPLSFGQGVHYCLGAALARLEGEVALSRLFRRYPGLSLACRPAFVPYASIRRYDEVIVATG